MEIPLLGITITRGQPSSIETPRSAPSPQSYTGFDILLALFGGVGDLIDLADDRARTVYQLLVTTLFSMIGIILSGFIFNLLGLYSINIIAATVFAVVTAILWWRPGQVAWVGVAGAIIGALDHKDVEHGGLSKGAKWLIEEYFNIFKIVMLVGTVSLFYLGFVPFGANWIVFFVIIGGGITASLLADRYKISGTFAGNLAFWGICIIIAIGILSLIPASSWGADQSFMSRFMLALISNIKGGLFLFGILLSMIAVLVYQRSKAPAGKEGSRIWIFLLVGLMDSIFMPNALLWDARPWGKHDAPSQPSVSRSDLQWGPEQTATKEWTNISFRGGVPFSVWCIGDGLQRVTYLDSPNGLPKEGNCGEYAGKNIIKVEVKSTVTDALPVMIHYDVG